MGQNLDLLRGKLKTLKGIKSAKPFEDSILRLCAGAIPQLHDNDDNICEAFNALRHFASVNQFVLYMTEALTTLQDHAYVMNLPLLQRLVTYKVYRSAIDAWIHNHIFRDNATRCDCDLNAVAAYSTTFGDANPSAFVTSKQTKRITDKWNAETEVRSETWALVREGD
ncbi:hypothetical protein [Bifidobacterium tibiigranuli]|jgi:hypothetical protein|uniref:hypothetical protein n=1 Tax=Bifidobacterium tibiigranuli TaxID=2172043 RepID=UPI0026EABD13|nr:hypothetical protein [Bifidobacterium tibiigranuli]MCI1713967.1 hypothetical protein [Bifidobacterium tibiigranuli]